MMKTLLCVTAFVSLASFAQAQAIVIGPTSRLAWDVAAPDVVTAQSFTYTVTVDATPPKAMTTVTCAASVPLVAGMQTCSAPVAQIAAGSHAITMVSSSGTIISAPSLAFTYVDLAIPVPLNLRLVP